MVYSIALRKTGRALLTVLLLVSVTFMALRLTGDPATMMLGVEVPEDALEQFRERWGLDKPLWTQYLIYVRGLLEGDFGRSFIGDRSAWEVVAERLPKTLLLMGLTTFFALIIGIPAGMIAALHRNSWIDRLFMSIAAAGPAQMSTEDAEVGRWGFGLRPTMTQLEVQLAAELTAQGNALI